MNARQKVTDQMGREVILPDEPKRIISLVPSQTEFLYSLGLDERVVAQTIFCVHPAKQHLLKPRIGGTKKLNIEKIISLQPDLIIGNKEENSKEQILELEKLFPVWMSDILDLEDSLLMMKSIGSMLHKEAECQLLMDQIQLKLQELNNDVEAKPILTKKVLYLIWADPWMAAGKHTFIDSVLTSCGFQNVVAEQHARYPELNESIIASLQPDVIFLSSEPFPFKEKHKTELQNICHAAHIIDVDGEFFSWYGSRLQHAIPYFIELRNSLHLIKTA